VSAPEWLSIGQMVERTGVAHSALRFYEQQGLLDSERTSGGQRRFRRDSLRRVAFIRVAQRIGLSLDEIREALARLPDQRTPTRADWTEVSDAWRPRLEEQIANIVRLRDQLDSCIGCGCLSLDTCGLYNPEDAARVLGPGPRYLLGDRPGDALG